MTVYSRKLPLMISIRRWNCVIKFHVYITENLPKWFGDTSNHYINTDYNNKKLHNLPQLCLLCLA